jgi:hypothetical protein
MNKFYNEIDKALQSYENCKPYHTHTIEWIADRISWCWKWRKITEEQMHELCDRVVNILEGRI